jgi:hypothetical protein
MDGEEMIKAKELWVTTDLTEVAFSDGKKAGLAFIEKHEDEDCFKVIEFSAYEQLKDEHEKILAENMYGLINQIKLRDVELEKLKKDNEILIETLKEYKGIKVKKYKMFPDELFDLADEALNKIGES